MGDDFKFCYCYCCRTKKEQERVVLAAQGCECRSCLATLLDTEAPLERQEGKECPSKTTLVKKVESSNPRDGK